MSLGEVSEHYSVTDLGNQILAALESAGKDLRTLTVEDLAAVDEFHIRGRTATEELAQWAGIQPSDLLLDVGCGLGGTCRYLAASVGCDIVGVDLTDDYIRVAEMLSARVGLGERTVFRQGSALSLPFADDRFDVVWTEHVQMNISEKSAFYGELARVLKAGGRLAFHDIFSGDRDGLHFPVPWAPDASISHLATVDYLQTVLAEAGFAPARWEDKSEESVAFFEKSLQRAQNNGQPPVGLHLLMGNDAATKFGNMHRNLVEGRVRVVQAVMRRV